MAEGQDKRPKDAWDKLSVLSALLASVLVPISVAVVGNWYTAAIGDREIAISDRDQKIRQATFEREWVQLGLEIWSALSKVVQCEQAPNFDPFRLPTVTPSIEQNLEPFRLLTA